MSEATVINAFTKVTPVKQYHSASASAVADGHPSPNGSATAAPFGAASHHHSTAAPLHMQWVETFASRYFTCAGCSGILIDPIIVHETNLLACRNCASHLEPSEIRECPSNMCQAVSELRAALTLQPLTNSARKMVKVRRAKGPNASPAPGETSKAFFHVVAGGATGSSADTVMFSASNQSGSGVFQDVNTFQGLNPNVEVASQKLNNTPQKQAAASAAATQISSAPSSAQKAAVVAGPAVVVASLENPQPNNQPTTAEEPAPTAADAKHNTSAPHSSFVQAMEDELASQERDFLQIERRLQLGALMDLAQKEYDEIVISERLDSMDLTKKHKAELRTLLVKQRDNSKALKNRADEKYEASQYAAAIDLYSKALEARVVDGLTKVATLYGNRSAAYYMAGRFQEALDDCLAVLEKEPETVKMYQRAAKCSVSLGDLERARSYFSMIPEEKMTPTYAAERDKIEEGFKVFERAQRTFGKSEGDESWLMLVALYSEQTTFRMRCAEHFAFQKQYQRAIETLSVVVGNQRTHSVASAMARWMYMSGFEYFDRARTVLEPHRTHHPECQELYQLINVVDDGKQQGNQLFSQKKFADAAMYYTKAIDAAKQNDQILRILYCNRAAAYKELGRYKEGVEDCTKALRVDHQFTKAYARRARCHQLLGDHHAAIRDFKNAVKYDPQDTDLVEELRRAELLLADEAKKEKDFYYVLGVSRTATEEQIRAKYKELALRWHPDKCMHMEQEEKNVAEHKFKTISSAYQTLVDVSKRREYDLKQEKDRITKSSAYSSFFTSGNPMNMPPGGGPSAPTYSRYGGGMPERRAQNFW